MVRMTDIINSVGVPGEAVGGVGDSRWYAVALEVTGLIPWLHYKLGVVCVGCAAPA